MRYTALTRPMAGAATMALVLAAFWAGPAEAAKRKKIKCPAFTAGYEDAADADLVKITDKATEKKPVVIEYEHAAALSPVADEYLYYNVQLYSQAKKTGLYILQEFEDDSDIDLYLYDAAGEEVASSGAFNPAPIPGVTDSDGTGGVGYESISGFAATRCSGFSIESHAFMTPGTPVTLQLWLGKPVKPEE